MSDQQKPNPAGKTGRPKSLPQNAQWMDFVYLPSQGKYVYTPTRAMWDRSDVVRTVKSNDDMERIDTEMACKDLTWCPGLPMIIKDRVVFNGSWRAQLGAKTFNHYCPPDPIPSWADPMKAEPWVKLARFLFPDTADHVIAWLAFKAQHPDIKINHGLVIGSPVQRLGKDALLKGAHEAIGPWNWGMISATAAFKGAEDKNSFLRSVILQMSEGHAGLGPHRFAFYETTKDWFASTSKDTISVQDKWLVRHEIFNRVGGIVTTNHPDGVYIPSDDGRLHVSWSTKVPADLPLGYMKRYHEWVTGLDLNGNVVSEQPGNMHVAAYLMTSDLELSEFDPFQPPPKTEGWHAAVAAATQPVEQDLCSVLAEMGDRSFGPEPDGTKPEAITITSVVRWCAGVMAGDLPGDEAACEDLHSFFVDRGNRKTISHRLTGAGFTPARNPDRPADGYYRIDGKPQAVYVRRDLTGRARTKAIKELIAKEERIIANAAAKAAAAKAAAAAAVKTPMGEQPDVGV